MAEGFSRLLLLPAELRIKILDCLIRRASDDASAIPNTIHARARGFTDGTGHITVIQEGDTWRSVSLAGPQHFCLLSTAVLRTCRLIHAEMSELLYGKILFVVNMSYMRPMASSLKGTTPAIVATVSKPSMLLHSIYHVHVRQHIRPEEDLLQKVESLRSFLACLNPMRKTTEVTLHFESMWFFNDGEWPHKARPEYTWQLYSAEMARLDLGQRPEIRASAYWTELEGKERFETLALKIEGNVNNPDYIYW